MATGESGGMMNKYDTLGYIIIGFAATAKFLIIVISFPFWLPFYLIGRMVEKFNLDIDKILE